MNSKNVAYMSKHLLQFTVSLPAIRSSGIWRFSRRKKREGYAGSKTPFYGPKFQAAKKLNTFASIIAYVFAQPFPPWRARGDISGR